MLRLLGTLFAVWGKFRTLCLRHYWVRQFAAAGRNVSIGEGFRAYGPKHIRVGDDVVLSNRVVLRAATEYRWTEPPQAFSPELVLRRGCFINNGTEIACIGRVEIGENVLIAVNCFISDNTHAYEDPDISVKQQPMRSSGPLTVGEGTWIGANCCVVGGLAIGRHCVIGANSVVTADLPDYAIAVGAPARIVKRYDREKAVWVKVDPSRSSSET